MQSTPEEGLVTSVPAPFPALQPSMRSITLFVAQPSGKTSAAHVPFADNSRSLLWLPSPGALEATFDGNIAPIRLLQGRDLVVTISPGSRRVHGLWSGTEHTLVNLAK